MKLKSTKLKKIISFSVFLSIAFSFSGAKYILAQEEFSKASNTSTLEDRETQLIGNQYILGPGDVLFLEVKDIDNLTGNIHIQPDGNIYLKDIDPIYVEGLTIPQLKTFLENKLDEYYVSPEIDLKPKIYRPIKVYVYGQIGRPGYYLFESPSATFDQHYRKGTQLNISGNERKIIEDTESTLTGNLRLVSPTVYDALVEAGGVNDYTDISNIEVIRKLPKGSGGGRITTKVNLLNLIINGDGSQNIRLFDGDVIKVAKSKELLTRKIQKMAKTTLSPKTIAIYVSGRVKSPGALTAPNGFSLNQAILMAGGTKTMKGNIEFLRFSEEGPIDKRSFSYNANSKIASFNNPILRDGDIIRVNDTLLTSSFEVLNEATKPAIGLFSLLNLVRALK